MPIPIHAYKFQYTHTNTNTRTQIPIKTHKFQHTRTKRKSSKNPIYITFLIVTTTKNAGDKIQARYVRRPGPGLQDGMNK